MKIWQKYIFLKLTQTFFFFLFCLFSVYVIVDLSAHGIRFFSQSPFLDIALYYFQTFAALLGLFLTLSFLLAMLRVLYDLNIHREFLSLQMAGISKKRLLTPFFIFAGFLSCIGYLNDQWFAPEAQETTLAFKTSHKSKKKRAPRVCSVLLEDDSELVYQSFDPEKKELYDVFWIRTPADIWHMKYLQIDPLVGHFVHHLTRNTAKRLEKSESYTTYSWTDFPWNESIAFQKVVPLESRPILTLCMQAFADSAERSRILTHLYYKLVSPLIPFLVLFTIGPICIRFSRTDPIFVLVAVSVFGFIALKVILDGMLILGETQVLPASVAILGPILLISGFSIRTFLKME